MIVSGVSITYEKHSYKYYNSDYEFSPIQFLVVDRYGRIM